MCKYCEDLFTGDCNESLVDIRIPIIFNTQMLNVDVFINDDELEVYVDCDSTGYQVAKSKIKIEYCPMCGTRLKKRRVLTRALSFSNPKISPDGFFRKLFYKIYISYNEKTTISHFEGGAI